MQRVGGSTGIQKAAELITVAQKSVGDVMDLEKAKQDLGWLIAEYGSMVNRLESIQKQILTLLSEIPMANQLRSIKGLDPIFIAAI